MNYLDLTIEEMKKSLDEKKVTSMELLEASIKRNNDLSKLNCFVTITEDKAKEMISNLDSIKDNPLKGIPCAIKDNLSTKDILTTASSNILKDYVPFFNATVVNKLYENGAVSIGKTVLDELAMGGTGTTGHTGTVCNPWDNSRLIGGSSAGSAAAVAAGIVPFALGSDTGDSIRKPAIYGGVVGYKPTYGRVSRFGLFPFACSLDHVGCFTRSVKDTAIVMDAIKGKDERDMTSIEDDNISYYENITGEVKGKKLFYISELIDRDNYKDSMDEELTKILDNFDEVINKCKELEMSVEGVSIDKKILSAIYPTYITISCAEATSNNSNLTGIIFGPRGEGESINDIMFNARTTGFSELIKRRFILGSYILQKENQEKLFLNAGRIRRIIVEKMTELFKEYDGMILPGSGSVAPTFRSETIDKLSDRYLWLENHMAIGNFGGFPSISIPTGFVDNMPIGLSITSGIKKDLDLLNIAYAVESKFNYKGQIAKEVK